MTVIDKVKIEDEFFNKLAEVLEKHFPKGACCERSQALVLNAFANLFLKEAIDTVVAFYEDK